MESTRSFGLDVLTYEQRLNHDGRWALDQGGLHFEGESLVQKSLRRIARRLEELDVDYAVAGGMALFKHGFRRFTEDVDILIARESLKTIHERLEDLGYVPLFTGSKSLRDAESGVRIKFLVAGEFPGDGKPKPVAFPRPGEANVVIDGIRVLSLPNLVELKLASGMTNLGRLKDLADVIELIKARGLTERFADELNPYVREKYLELWRGLRDAPAGPSES